ncbi:MAG: 30S ribosomal protein S7 [Acidobacteria bacterium]|nr:30S ribosomal protein S7 [Acidobacteriota bacterium]
MPRRKIIQKKEILPDPIYNSVLVTRFVNSIMKDGKKSVAQSILYGAFDVIKDKTNENPLKVFQTAVDNVKPILEVKSRRVGGATYQVPVEVSPKRQLSLSIRWILSYSRQRSEPTMRQKLAGELIDAYQKKGTSIKKREDTHKMAEANKAFAHFRW